MQLIKNTFFALALLAGCSAQYEADESTLESDLGEDEIGQLEQPISAGAGPSGAGYGVSTGSTRAACNQPGSSGQDCRIPYDANKTIEYCFASGADAGLVTSISLGVELVDSNLNTWTFTPVTTFPCQMPFSLGVAISGAGTQIDHFMNPLFSGTITTLTSAGTPPQFAGSWKSFTALSVQVDGTDVLASSNPPALAFQVGAHAAAIMTGLGTRTDAAVLSSPTRRGALTAPIFNLTTGEQCRANNYNPASGAQSHISTSNVCGSTL